MEFFTNVAYASVDTIIANANKLIINPLIYFLFALAVVYFLYGVVQFLANPDNEEKRTAGKSHMIYGIIGLVVMMGVFFILNVILGTFGITGIDVENGTVTLPPYP